MPLHFTEADVARLVDMPSAIEAVEQAFRHWADGQAENQPRRRVSAAGAMLHVMSAADSALGFLGCKIYSTTRQAARFQYLLYESGGEPVATFDADRLGQIRTGAVSGVATKFMAREDAQTVGCFGTGWQARSQLQAVCAVRSIQRIQVYSRDAHRREAFARDMTELLGVPVEPVDAPVAAVTNQDIVITATTSKTPVFDGRDLAPGTHLNVIGGNYLSKAEIDATTIERADRIVCDSLAACQLEAGDFVPALENGSFRWTDATELTQLVSGREPGRTSPAEITLFKSVGLALEDLAVAVLAYRQAAASD